MSTREKSRKGGFIDGISAPDLGGDGGCCGSSAGGGGGGGCCGEVESETATSDYAGCCGEPVAASVDAVTTASPPRSGCCA